MKTLPLVITMVTIYGLHAMYLPPEEESIDLVELSTCVDCFGRHVAHGAKYWDGCKFCTCDRAVPQDERCQPSGCYFSPCPRIRGEIQSHDKSKEPGWGWSKVGWGRR